MGEKADELRQKKRELEQHRVLERELEEEISKLTRKVIAESLAEKLITYEQEKLDKPIGLNNLIIRDFLCFDKTAEEIGLENIPIHTMGSLPWKKDEFEEFLLSKNFNCVDLDESPHILILGSLAIDTKNIDHLIDSEIFSDSQLKIYTQELFVYYLITGEDPLEMWDEDTLIASVEGHTGLDHVLSITKFEWPNSNAGTPEENFISSVIDPENWSEDSPLSKLGYTVREGALSENERHQILRKAFNEPLTNYLNEDSEIRVWGKPKSARRLYAIAHFIKWLSSFQGGTKPAAANKWKNDLQWLKNQFYLPRMAFKWPNQSINLKVNNKNIKESTVTNKVKKSTVNKKSNVMTKVNTFASGQEVYHKKFGWGRVTRRFVESNRIEVKFFNLDYGSKIFDRSIADFYQ